MKHCFSCLIYYFCLSFNWSYFSEGCDRLKMVFSLLSYPDRFINSSISRFIAVKASDQPELPAANNELDPVRVVVPFTDQASTDILRAQLKGQLSLSQVTVQPSFVSHKIKQHLELHEVRAVHCWPTIPCLSV